MVGDILSHTHQSYSECGLGLLQLQAHSMLFRIESFSISVSSITWNECRSMARGNQVKCKGMPNMSLARLKHFHNAPSGDCTLGQWTIGADSDRNGHGLLGYGRCDKAGHIHRDGSNPCASTS